ncbi:MAG: hypothetical protein M1829_002988 [Trizodia sp. TS-e1964]|nr:MAG: hypothetical protein M1829_002988 [Trizodia sp. TS-e1964]
MEASDILLLLRILESEGIACCVIGVIALNYYNVPRVIYDLEICVPEADLSRAQKVFSSKHGPLETAEGEENYNSYTEYKRGFPRYRHISAESCFHVILFSDTFCHLAPLQKNVIPSKEYQQGAEYSRELMDLVPVSLIPKLRLPRLAPLFEACCRKYCETREDMSAIAAEQLVDGMNLDEDWCRKNMSPARLEELNFALKLVAAKKSRISAFTHNIVTDFIATSEEAERLLRVPGRG